MEGTFESATEHTMAIFVGSLLALLVALVMLGRTDDLRRGVRALIGAPESLREAYTAPRLEDYGGPFQQEEEDADREYGS
jgi:uncharacterized membrane protein YgaE (UPF0421/DUF939 family)